MPQGPMSSPLMKPFVVLALPGMYLFYKYNQYKRKRKENAKRRLTERELQHLNNKIEKLLNKLEETEPELATCQEEECVICIHAKATMQTAPCGHQVVCRKCFVKTIQIAVSQRLLPLRCVICRAKILRLKTGPILPSSVSGYSVNSRSSVPPSASLYSVSSTATGSSVSSTTSCSSESSCGSKASNHNKTSTCCSGGQCFGGAYPRQPQSGAFRRSQQHAMKMRLLHDYGTQKSANRLPPIRESSPLHYAASPAQQTPPPPSTRIRCAQKIVTQLESAPAQYKKGAKKLSNCKYTRLPQEDSDDMDLESSNGAKEKFEQVKRKKSWFSSLSLSQSSKSAEEKIDNKKNELAEKHQMKMKKMYSFHEFGHKSTNELNEYRDEGL